MFLQLTNEVAAVEKINFQHGLWSNESKHCFEIEHIRVLLFQFKGTKANGNVNLLCLFLAGRNRMGFHGESLPCRSESSRWLTASLVLAGPSRLSFSRRVFSVQVVESRALYPLLHGEYLPRKTQKSFCCKHRQGGLWIFNSKPWDKFWYRHAPRSGSTELGTWNAEIWWFLARRIEATNRRKPGRREPGSLCLRSQDAVDKFCLDMRVWTHMRTHRRNGTTVRARGGPGGLSWAGLGGLRMARRAGLARPTELRQLFQLMSLQLTCWKVMKLGAGEAIV